MQSENRLIMNLCKFVELARILHEAKNIIVALRPFITKEATFEDSYEVFYQDVDLDTDARHLLAPDPQTKRPIISKQTVQKTSARRNPPQIVKKVRECLIKHLSPQEENYHRGLWLQTKIPFDEK